jgi:hypothetical protein
MGPKWYGELHLVTVVKWVVVGSQVDARKEKILREKFGDVRICLADSDHAGGQNLYRRLCLFKAIT